jgi:hypothetical protein
MQAIARVNRVFSNKPGGLVVDYLGLTLKIVVQIQRRDKVLQIRPGIDGRVLIGMTVEPTIVSGNVPLTKRPRTGRLFPRNIASLNWQPV